MTTHFSSLIQMTQALPTDTACREYLELRRWNGVPTCPHCTVVDEKHYKLTVKGEFKGLYKCRECKERFTVTVGTIFEGSNIGLHKWFLALYLFSAHKKGVSSHQLARDLAVTQKTAWFMLHRLRMAFTDNTDSPLGGEGTVVETDVTWVGGKTTNMHKGKRREMRKDRSKGWDNKTQVSGYVERGGNIRFDVIDPHENEKDLVRKHIDKDSILMTDDANHYRAVGKEYAAHEVVNHSIEEYVREKVWHTNTIEGAFSLFDRMTVGTYHYISPKHMQAYCNELGFRYNSRKITDKMRFDMALVKTSGVKLQYSTLIAK